MNFTLQVIVLGYKIKPGKRLSLQKHFHRNEHWIVVSGTATVTVGDKMSDQMNQPISKWVKFIDLKIPVVLIEAQVGDIVRIEDDFKRE